MNEENNNKNTKISSNVNFFLCLLVGIFLLLLWDLIFFILFIQSIRNVPIQFEFYLILNYIQLLLRKLYLENVKIFLRNSIFFFIFFINNSCFSFMDFKDKKKQIKIWKSYLTISKRNSYYIFINLFSF